MAKLFKKLNPQKGACRKDHTKVQYNGIYNSRHPVSDPSAGEKGQDGEMDHAQQDSNRKRRNVIGWPLFEVTGWDEHRKASCKGRYQMKDAMKCRETTWRQASETENGISANTTFRFWRPVLWLATACLHKAIDCYSCQALLDGTPLFLSRARSRAVSWCNVRARSPVSPRVSYSKYALHKPLLCKAISSTSTIRGLRFQRSNDSDWERLFYRFGRSIGQSNAFQIWSASMSFSAQGGIELLKTVSEILECFRDPCEHHLGWGAFWMCRSTLNPKL